MPGSWWQRKGDALLHRDLTKPSEQPFYASGHDGCFPFADEEKEAQKLSDMPKITMRARSLSASGAHALHFRLLCLRAAEHKQPRGPGHGLNGAIMLCHPQLSSLQSSGF